MHVSRYDILVAVLVVALLASVVWLLRILLKKDRYTRERFAFAGLTSLAALGLTVVSAISQKETLWGSLINLVGDIWGNPRPTEPPHFSDHVLMVIIFAGMVWFVVRVFEGWDGAVSVRQFEKQRYSEPASFVADGLYEARRVLRREPQLERYQPAPPNLERALGEPRDSLAWHIQARDLICLTKRDYVIDRDEAWHSDARCWVGLNKRTRAVVAIRCDVDHPTDAELKEFVRYVRLVTLNSSQDSTRFELIAASRVRASEASVNVDGITVTLKSEDSLLDGLVDFSDYFLDLKVRVEEQTLPDSSLTLADVYVPSSCRDEARVSHPDLEAYIRKWSEERGQRQLALLGEYGQGKSTAALMIAYRMTRTSDLRRVPILIELRGKSPRNMTPEELLAGWASPYGIDPRALIKLLVAGRLLLILEGFDEMDLIGSSDSRIAHFRTLWQFAYPAAKILITGRPNFFLDDLEMKAALGIARPSGAGPYCEAVHLVPFSLQQISAALRNAGASTRTEVVNLARRDEKFREIVSRGSLLYVVGQLWEREKLSQHAGNINSAFVMDLFIKHSYRRQSAKVTGKAPDFMVLSEEERAFFMCGIAAQMAALELPNQISPDEFERAVKSLYDAIPESVSTVVEGAMQKPRMPLRVRLKDMDDALEGVITDVRSGGILVRDQAKSGSLRFAHKSFMEFLAARPYADKISGFKSESTAALLIATRLKLWHVVRREESFTFLAELLVVMSRTSMLGGRETCRWIYNRAVVDSLEGGLWGRFCAWLAIRGVVYAQASALAKSDGNALTSAYFGVVPSVLMFPPGRHGAFREGLLVAVSAMAMVQLLFETILMRTHGARLTQLGNTLTSALATVAVVLVALSGVGISLRSQRAETLLRLWVVCCVTAGLKDEDMEPVVKAKWRSLIIAWEGSSS
jgi:hypothetical protein